MSNFSVSSMHHSRSIETARLILSQPNDSDILYLRDLWKNKLVREYLGGVIDDNLINERIKSIQNHWREKGFGLWTSSIKNTLQITGICGLHHSEDGIEISYMFSPEWWGKGLAHEAITASLNYGFNLLNFEKIIAITQEANYRSCCLLEKVGMQLINSFIRFDQKQCLYEALNKNNT